MAKFCSQCGAPLEEEDLVCGQCGTPIAGAAQPGGSNSSEPVIKTDNGKTKMIGIIAAAAVVVIILIVIISTVAGSAGSGYEKTISKAVKAIKNYDVDGFEDLLSSYWDDFLFDWYGDDYVEEDINDILDYLEDETGSIKKMTYEITDVNEYSDRKLDNTIEEMEEGWDEDFSYIKKMVEVEVEITAKGSSDSESITMEFMLFKEKGSGWKIASWDWSTY